MQRRTMDHDNEKTAKIIFQLNDAIIWPKSFVSWIKDTKLLIILALTLSRTGGEEEDNTNKFKIV